MVNDYLAIIITRILPNKIETKMALISEIEFHITQPLNLKTANKQSSKVGLLKKSVLRVI